MTATAVECRANAMACLKQAEEETPPGRVTLLAIAQQCPTRGFRFRFFGDVRSDLVRFMRGGRTGLEPEASFAISNSMFL
jgi:hypothetical protein